MWHPPFCGLSGKSRIICALQGYDVIVWWKDSTHHNHSCLLCMLRHNVCKILSRPHLYLCVQTVAIKCGVFLGESPWGCQGRFRFCLWGFFSWNGRFRFIIVCLHQHKMFIHVSTYTSFLILFLSGYFYSRFSRCSRVCLIIPGTSRFPPLFLKKLVWR